MQKTQLLFYIQTRVLPIRCIFSDNDTENCTGNVKEKKKHLQKSAAHNVVLYSTKQMACMKWSYLGTWVQMMSQLHSFWSDCWRIEGRIKQGLGLKAKSFHLNERRTMCSNVNLLNSPPHNLLLIPWVHENAESSHCLNVFERLLEWRTRNPWHGIKAHPSYMFIFTRDTQRGHPLCTWYWLQPLVSPFLSIRKQACHVFIHLSIQRGWLVLPCSPAQDLSLGDSGQLCSPTMPCIPPDLPWFPCMPSLWAGRIVGLSDGATGIHPDSRPAIHPAIHAIERLTSCTPMAQNKASLWGTVVGFVPPPIMPRIPQTCPGSPLKAQGTGRSRGLSTPPLPLFSAWCYRCFRSLSAASPSLPFFHFFGTALSAPSFYWCPFFFSSSHKTDS